MKIRDHKVKLYRPKDYNNETFNVKYQQNENQGLEKSNAVGEKGITTV